MGGGIIQLMAYGSQDRYLSGNPQMTFFRSVYKRHTHFAIESLPQVFTGRMDFGQKLYCDISKDGDLVNKMYIEIELECTENYKLETVIHNNAHVLINSVDIVIGGNVIDRHYGEWLAIWAELSNTTDNKLILDELLRPTITNEFNNPHKGKVCIPLQFWFNRYLGSSLPLIALEHSDVRIVVELNKKDLVWNNVLAKNNTKLELN